MRKWLGGTRRDYEGRRLGGHEKGEGAEKLQEKWSTRPAPSESRATRGGVPLLPHPKLKWSVRLLGTRKFG